MQIINLINADIALRRKYRGYSQQEFAGKIKMKPQSLCRLEKGQGTPNVKTLKKIEDVLMLPSGFYTERRQAIIDHQNNPIASPSESTPTRFVPIYTNHTFDKIMLEQMFDELSRMVNQYTLYESALKLPSATPFNLNEYDMSNGTDGLVAAQNLRRKLGIGTTPLNHLLPLLEQNNIRIVPTKGLSPCVLPSNKDKWRHAFPLYDTHTSSLVIAVNEISPASEQLYDIAYSIGAYFRFLKIRQQPNCKLPTDESEFCRAFAAELLTPYEDLQMILYVLKVNHKKPTLEVLDTIAAPFGISAETLVHTLKSFGFFNDITARKLLNSIKKLNNEKECHSEEISNIKNQLSKLKREIARLQLQLDNLALPDRPEITFGYWLKTLQIAAWQTSKSSLLLRKPI